jgi:hypothetical protein
METLLLLSALAGGSYYVWRKAGHFLNFVNSSRRVTVSTVYQRQNYIAKSLQVALATLAETPDFQRALSWGVHAQQVPAWFRQQIFTRFRCQLVDHLTARLTAGEDGDVLLEQLRQLVQTLSMAPFEAEYIEREARQRLVQSRPAPRGTSYDQQLRTLRTAHEQRMGAIRGLEGIDSEVRAQLLEAEQSRFRDAILALGN